MTEGDGARKMDEDRVRISVVTVTYNSAATVGETVRSVLDQTYPVYEYIIIDACSTDDTLAIVEGYRADFEGIKAKLIVVSEPDEGIYDAMNKGTQLASGDIVGIINSDDRYEADALKVVADTYRQDPFDLFWADIRMVRPDGRSFIKHAKDRSYATSRDWNHPTTFITKKIYEKYRYRCDNIHDDYDLILRLKRDGAKTRVVNKVLADFSMSGVSHKRSVKAAVSSIRTKYMIYRRCGYSRWYLIECIMVEAGKLIIG